MIKLAIIIMTKNEAVRLPACLASVKDCGDVFVIDSNSTDDTCAIARAAGATVVNFTWDGQYPKKKQWSLDQLPPHYDWVLFVDADERLTPELQQELRDFCMAPPAQYNAYWITADPVFTGRRLRYGQSNRKICLQRRSQSSFPVVNDLAAFPHEVEGHYQPQVHGTVGSFTARMLHVCDPVPDWMQRHVNYAAANAKLAAAANTASDRGPRAWAKRWLMQHPHAGLFVFMYGYIFKLGFLDGRAGYNYAAARGWYYWLSGVLRESATAGK